MEFLADYGLFLAKTVTIVAALAVLISIIASLSMRHKTSSKEHVEVTCINDRYRDMTDALEAAILSRDELKQKNKQRKKERKAQKKAKADDKRDKARLFVIDFDGDIRGSEVALLREEITAILTVAAPTDEVLLRLESSGGLVHAYGLAASQLARIRDRGIHLTVSVDKIAASGGYLMASVANRIIAAPFSILGSIGVITQIPNFHRLLRKHDIDFEQVTAGEFKRTVTMFGETTERARQKLKEEVEDTHVLFKDFVKSQRPVIDLEQVATGEHWLGTRALELNLVDELRTSDDFLMSMRDQVDIYEVRYSVKQNIVDRFSSLVATLFRKPSVSEPTPPALL